MRGMTGLSIENHENSGNPPVFIDMLHGHAGEHNQNNGWNDNLKIDSSMPFWSRDLQTFLLFTIYKKPHFFERTYKVAKFREV